MNNHGDFRGRSPSKITHQEQRSLSLDSHIDLDRLIEEMDSELEIPPKPTTRNKKEEWWDLDEFLKDTFVEEKKDESKIRCLPLLVGDAHQSKGCSRFTEPRICDRLGCLSCDLPVVVFSDQRWSNQVDDLFLRLHAPWDKKGLSSLLEVAPGAQAYCCQCRHFVVKSGLGLIEPPAPWHCKGH